MIARHVFPALRRFAAFARTELTALAALLIAVLGVMAFIELADDMTEADGQMTDRFVLEALRTNGDPADPIGPHWLEEAAADITSLGGIAVLGLFALIAVGFLVIQRKWLSATLLPIGLAVGVALSEGLKALFERERPPVEYQAVETLNASFPSGHALLSTVFYLTVGVMLARAFPQRRFKVFVIAVAVLIAALVGLTRIYLGAHWANDVLAGWAIGAAWACVLALIAYGVERLMKARHAPLQDETVDEGD